MIRTHCYLFGLLLLGLSSLSHALNCNDVESIEWADFTKEKAQKYLDVCMEAARTNKTADNYFLIGRTLNILEQYERAYKYYLAAAEAGHAGGQNNIGTLYYFGQGLQKSLTESTKWYRKAAEQGYAKAQHNLGLNYSFGDGVKKSHTESAKWYRKAAEQGFSNSQYRLGLAYHNGEGVDKDLSKAVEWFRKAANQGHAGAQSLLGGAYYEGKGVNKDYSKAVEWFQKSVTQNDPRGQAWIGFLYESGTAGYNKNTAKATTWYKKSAEQGDDFAKTALTRLANAKNNACETLQTSLEKNYYVSLDLEPNQSSCFNVQSFDGYLSVVTVKNLTNGGNAFATVHELQTEKPAGEGDLIPFSDLSAKKYRIFIYNNNAKPVRTRVYVHEVGFETALKGALFGAGMATVQSLLGLDGGDEENDDYFSAANNVSRALTIASSAVQGRNASQISIDAIANEIAINLREAGLGNATATIATSAVSSYLGEIYEYY